MLYKPFIKHFNLEISFNFLKTDYDGHVSESESNFILIEMLQLSFWTICFLESLKVYIIERNASNFSNVFQISPEQK